MLKLRPGTMRNEPMNNKENNELWYCDLSRFNKVCTMAATRYACSVTWFMCCCAQYGHHGCCWWPATYLIYQCISQYIKHTSKTYRAWLLWKQKRALLHFTNQHLPAICSFDKGSCVLLIAHNKTELSLKTVNSLIFCDGISSLTTIRNEKNRMMHFGCVSIWNKA